MSRLFCLIAVTGLAVCLSAISAEKGQIGDAAITQGRGCLESGVEAGCKVLKDTKTGILYNLFFDPSKEQPSLHTGIAFTGHDHRGMSFCMQGKGIQVTKWNRVKMRCPQGSIATQGEK